MELSMVNGEKNEPRVEIREVTLTLIISAMLALSLIQAGYSQPLPIGDVGYRQANPFDSNPTAGQFDGVGVPTGTIDNVFDGDLSSSINFYYGATASGYVEVSSFKKPSDTGLLDFAVTFVDVKISYRAASTLTNDDKYSIAAYVDPSTTLVVLQDWVTGNDAKYDPGLVLQAHRTFSNVAEPNDGAWNWSDIANLRVRFETQQVGSNNFQRVYLYEVWLTAYSTPYPASRTISVQPFAIYGLSVGSVFFIDVYVTDIENLWMYQFRINFTSSVLTALDYMSYGPFVSALPSEIGSDYVSIAYKTYDGDSTGFTGSTPLARIYFAVNAVDESTLDLQDVMFSDPFANPFVYYDVDGQFDNRPLETPKATFSWTPAIPMERETVTFDASSSTPNGGTIVSYSWNFGDGSPEVKETVPAMTHAYVVGSLKPYIVTLNVTDSEGYYDLEVKTITITKHDVAIDSVTILGNNEVDIGTIVNIRVKVLNEGNFPETFSVTTLYNETAFAEKPVVALASGSSETLNFQWDTIAFPGTYFIKAMASNLPQENDVEDNVKIDGDIILQGFYQFAAPNFSEPPSPRFFDTSEYLLGSVAVGIILPESIDGNYNWTQSEIDQTVNGVMDAMAWWKSQNPDAQLSFVFDVHLQVPTMYEPIEMAIWEDHIWIDDMMTNLGYTSGSAWEKAVEYNNNIRSALGTDWAFTIFVADSDYRVNQGLFAGATGYAHAYLGGPWITMSRLSSWAWNAANYYVAVPAHEMGHIFYATDEYNYAHEFSGYLDASDNDGSYGIMNENSLHVSASTRLQVGWRDLDHDGIADIMDTYPAIDTSRYPSEIKQLTYDFTGAVVDVPFLNRNPMGSRNNITINHIVSIQYSIDNGPWISALPVDGSFEEPLENYTFTASFSTWGMHSLKVRAENSVGNYIEETFTIEALQPHVEASFTWTPTTPAVDEPILFDASASYDPIGTIVVYTWDFGDGTIVNEKSPITYHTYGSPGTFSVVLTVVSDQGSTDTIAKNVTAKQRSVITISASPNKVTLGQNVIISGTLIPAKIGEYIVIEYRRQGYFEWRILAILTTDSSSQFTYVWTPGELGLYDLRSKWTGDNYTFPAASPIITVTVSPAPPTIIINPISGPVGTKVTVIGSNFDVNVAGYLMFDDQLIGYIIVESDGRLNATFNVPISQAGPHTIKVLVPSYLYYQWITASATFTVIDTTPLNVNVDVGAIYFKQDIAEVFVQTAFRGTPVNVTSIKATLYKSDGKTEILTLTRIATGLYKAQYLIGGHGSMVGTYTISVEAQYTNETVSAEGTSIKTFLVKPTWEREAPRIAAFSTAFIGLISAMIILWRKEKKRVP